LVSATKTIYFDESGFTGYNLLDPRQPVFAIASTDIEPSLAEKILKESFPKYQGKEFKFSNINNSSNFSGLATLGTLLKQYADRIYLHVIDKKFATFAKMVDFLVEPAITSAGYDFYANGFCHKYANYIYFGLTQIAEKNVYDDLVSFYLKFSRKPSEESLIELWSELQVLKGEVGSDAELYLDQMIRGCEILEEHFDLETFKETNDLQLTTMLAVVAHWRQQTKEDFIAVHDDSSNFLRKRKTWKAITSESVHPQRHPLGDGSSVEFPLRVVQTVSMNSADSYTIQLCDILAGFATAYMKRQSTEGSPTDIINEAAKNGLGDINYNGIFPRNTFPKFPPEKLNGPDAVDLMTQIIIDNETND